MSVSGGVVRVVGRPAGVALSPTLRRSVVALGRTILVQYTDDNARLLDVEMRRPTYRYDDENPSLFVHRPLVYFLLFSAFLFWGPYCGLDQSNFCAHVKQRFSKSYSHLWERSPFS